MAQQRRLITLYQGEGVALERVGSPGLVVTHIGIYQERLQISNPRGWKFELPLAGNAEEVVLYLQGLAWTIPGPPNCSVLHLLNYNRGQHALCFEVSDGFRALRPVSATALGLFNP